MKFTIASPLIDRVVGRNVLFGVTMAATARLILLLCYGVTPEDRKGMKEIE